MSRKTKHKKRKPVDRPISVPSWVWPTALGVLVVGTFLLRTIPSWDKIFVDGIIWFRGIDPWYHMRLADNMMANFPVPLEWDMMILYPHGMNVGYFPLMTWIITGLGQVFDYELVAVFLPPILGALSLIPVYFICKTLWKDWVGLVACGLIMLLPSELFHRSLLGFVDHHILEVFFLVCTLLFLVLLQQHRRVLWVVLAGVSLGLYMSSWTGGLLLVAVLWVWFVSIFMWRLKKGEPAFQFCKDMSRVFGIGLLLYLPNLAFIQGLYPSFLVFAAVAISPMLLLAMGDRLSWKRVLQGLIGCVVVACVVAQLVIPSVFVTARSVFVDLTSTIQEVSPSTASMLWYHYGLSFLLFIGGLIYAIKNRQNLLIIMWCVFMLVLVLSQRRWSYYFIIANSILAGYCLYAILAKSRQAVRIVVCVIVCVVLVAPIIPATRSISNLSPILSGDWYNACVWLRHNTPNFDGYDELETPQAEYGVLSWWDYGNWITRIGRRTPCSNPMNQHLAIQWRVLLARGEEEANSYLDGIDYIMVDHEMVTGKLYAIYHIAPDGWPLNMETFIGMLWEDRATTWHKVHESGLVRIYARV